MTTITLQEKNCPNCRSMFRPKRLSQKYCDADCAGQGRQNRAGVVCRACGKVFEYKRSQKRAYEGAGAFCSKQCSVNGVPRNCLLCGDTFMAYNGMGKYCSLKCKQNFFLQSSFDKKVRSISANLVMGSGKKETVSQMLLQALGTGCPYCLALLTIDNVSLDHKEAYDSSELRRAKLANIEVRRIKDRRENLHIICRDCNARKSNFDHDEYVTLLDFLEQNPKIRAKLFKRLAQAKALWQGRRFKHNG